MAFSNFSAGSAAGSRSGSVQLGPDLQEIQTSELEFSGFKGETKIKLLPSPWPDTSLPPPTSSLLSVASKAGILAAGGPESVVVAKLDAVREAFEQKEGDGNIKPFQTQLVIPVGIRVSQVAFSSDDSCLAISAEQGGGIAAYEVQSLLQGSTGSAFELGSDGHPLRALIPNPAPELAALFAAVTVKGQLMIADMKTRSWTSGPKGTIHQEGASAVAWSNRGKALLVGLGDGSIVQLKSDGSTMSQIPKPPNLQGDKHVSAISWLENDLALIVYTPSVKEGMAEPSDYYIWERTPKSDPPVHKFSKLPEVASGWGDRTPAFQFMSRLRAFHNCNHIILISTTPSEDVGIVCRSTTPLAEGAPTGVFVSATQANDSRRAQLPLASDMSTGTTPIGMDLDLASTKKVTRPIPGDEYDESPGPLPGLMILNNDGVLAAWWLVYADAIRKGISYNGLLSIESPQSAPSVNQSMQTQTQTQIANSVPSAFSVMSSSAPKPAFGQASSMGTSQPTGGFAQASKPVFGASSFGTPSSAGFNKSAATGTSSQIGATKATFGSPSPFGMGSSVSQSAGSVFGKASQIASSGSSQLSQAQPTHVFGSTTKTTAFGSSTSQASPFAAVGTSGDKSLGSSSPLNSGTSPFGRAASAAAASASPFGAPSGDSNSRPSPFGALGSTSGSASSPFGASSNNAVPKSSTFDTVAGPNKSVFGSGGAFSSESKNTFGQTTSIQDKDATTTATTNPFTKANPFGNNSFAGIATKTEKESKSTANNSGSSLFGAGFGSALDDTANTAHSSNDREENMEDDEEVDTAEAPESPEVIQSTTPKETPAPQKTTSGTVGQGGVASSWGSSQSTTTPSVETTKLTPTPTTPAFSFKHTPTPTFSFTKDTPQTSKGLEETTITTPKASDKLPKETPLPPDATSKDTFTPTNSSTSSIDTSQGPAAAEAAPLPPDFLLKAKSKLPMSSADDTPPLPPDFTKPLAPSKAPTSAPSKPEEKLSSAPSVPTEPPTPEAAPLPPDPVTSSRSETLDKKDEPAPPLPAEESSQFDDEGSGVDVANELSVEASPESSFGSKSSAGNVFVSKPFAAPAATKPPAASTKSVFESVAKPNVPFFEMPPPSKEPESPRSPSPVRSGRGMPDLRPPSTTMRSVSGPVFGKSAQGNRKVTLGRMPPPQKFVQPIVSRAAENEAAAAAEERGAAETKRQEQQAAEEQELSDQEDDYIRAELEAPLQPTTKMPAFLAHTDYTGGVNKGGVPGQIEVVYRDANSMIDTLGLNARALSSWIAGHSTGGRKVTRSSGSGRQRLVEDLDEPDSWTMVEVDDLVEIEEKVKQELEAGAISDQQTQVFGRLAHEITVDMNRIRKRNGEIAQTVERLQMAVESTPDGSISDESANLAPLSAVAAESQHDLRRALGDFRSNLAEAEEGLALLRARLSSAARSGGETTNGSQTPTVEAVERTIGKMTAMFERKSADLDVLTAQAKRLGIADEKRAATNKGNLQSLTGSGMHSRSGSPFESPVAARTENSSRSYHGSPLRGSIGQAQLTPSKSRLSSSLVLVDRFSSLELGSQRGQKPSEETARRYAEKLKIRKDVKAAMKDALSETKPRVRTLDD